MKVHEYEDLEEVKAEILKHVRALDASEVFALRMNNDQCAWSFLQELLVPLYPTHRFLLEVNTDTLMLSGIQRGSYFEHEKETKH